MPLLSKVTRQLVYLLALLSIAAGMGTIALYLAVGPQLPEVASIQKIRLQTPMRIYSSDNRLIAEFGDKRRIPITLDQVPQDFINALLSTEDQRFYEHSGVDFWGIARAVVNLIKTGEKGQGGSTITMQVARNYYLTREKRFARKFTEIFLAWKIESELTKDKILELYVNKIHFGHRAYGLGAASQVYYGKRLKQLSLAQLATLAGIPKGESKYNPISNPHHALDRRTHVLGRMLNEKRISQQQYTNAMNEAIKTTKHGARTLIHAPYFAEMVRQKAIKDYGIDIAYNNGLRIYTTLNTELQSFAQEAVIDGLEQYDRRHGYRGPEQSFSNANNASHEELNQWLKSIPTIGHLQPGIIVNINKEREVAKVHLKSNKVIDLTLENIKWAREYVDENHRGKKIETISDALSIGDQVRIKSVKTINKGQPSITYHLAQIPDISSGFVALNPSDGAIKALVGGYNFSLNQYNGATQARRQLGSNIKPFIYSAAFEKQFTPASIINDMPIVERDVTAENFWRPINASENYRGPTRLRDGLRLSKNTISIRLIREVGARYAKKYLQNIGFPGKHMQPYNSLALGAASFTPLEVATAYASFANGGYKVNPWFIQRVENSSGQIITEHQATQVCHACEEIISQQQKMQDEITNSNQMVGINKPDSSINRLALNQDSNQFHNLPLLPVPANAIAPRVIEERNHYLIDHILKDVILRGTATSTLRKSNSYLLKRKDLAGKTGTTNGPKDAWFSGYNTQLVATTWVGFNDHAKKIGNREYGGTAALPIWQKFMEKALKKIPEANHPVPEGIVTVKIDPKTGQLANSLTQGAIFEQFRSENAPTTYSEKPLDDVFNQGGSTVTEDDSLF